MRAEAFDCNLWHLRNLWVLCNIAKRRTINGNLRKPKCIYNGDESGFLRDPDKVQICWTSNMFSMVF